MNTSLSTVRLDQEGEITLLTLNRPEKRNAISPRMIEDLSAALDQVERSGARVVILTGAGKAFCAGMDIDALRALAAQPREAAGASDEGVTGLAVRVLKGDPEASEELRASEPRPSDAALDDARRIAQLFRRIYDYSKPLIAAVNGAAVAGGCGLATLCDLTLAAPEAKFGYTEVRIGFMPALVSIFLVRQIGEKRARDLLLTGRILDAEEALRLGLVNEIVAGGKLLERARELASELAELSPTSLASTKRLLRDLGEKALDHELETAIEASATIRSRPDFREGVSAFLEKRRPVWQADSKV